MARTYNKAEADVRFAHGVGSLVYTGIVSTNPTNYTVGWSALEYFVDGVKQTPADGTLTLATSTLNQLLVGDNTGTVSLVATVLSTQVLISTIDTDGSGTSSQTDATQGAVIDRLGGASVDHNTLLGLQGGAASEYYHLDQALYNALLNGARNVDTVSVSTYTAGGITVNLGTPHVNTNYSISLIPIVNLSYTEDISYNYVITAKTTTSFTVFITKESFGTSPLEYVKEELPDGSDGILTDISYITIEESSAVGNNTLVRYHEIQLWSDGATSPSTSKVNGITITGFPSGADSDIDFQFQVPENYITSNDISLYSSFSCVDVPPNSVGLDLVVTLFKTGSSDTTNPALPTQRTIVKDTVILPSVANILGQHIIQLTTTGGNIGTGQVGRGDLIQVNYKRNTTIINNAPSDFNLMSLGIRY